METTAERRSVASVRSDISWAKVAAWSALVTTILFATMNWHGCWLFMHEARELVVFVYPFTWLVIFFALRARWRLVLLLLTIFAAPVFLFRFGMVERYAGFESAAVMALHQLQSSLQTYRSEHQQQEYPEGLPAVKLRFSAQKYYRFEYVRIRSASGRILHYLIQATPVRRDCDFHRSFTITDDGSVFWTLEPRAATLSDTFLPE
jgi:hypothetical protein